MLNVHCFSLSRAAWCFAGGLCVTHLYALTRVIHVILGLLGLIGSPPDSLFATTVCCVWKVVRQRMSR